MKVPENRLLVGSLAGLALYWIVGFSLPTPYLSSAMSLFLLVTGALTLWRYLPSAWDIVVEGHRSDEPGAEGSHFAVYGTALLAAGSCYVGTFGLLWIWFGQPPDWLGTAVSGFGRGVMATGFWCMYISPDVARGSSRVPSMFWMVCLVCGAIAAAFFIGTRVGPL